MTRLITFISFILLANITVGQNLNYKDYVLSDFQLFCSIDNDYLSFLNVLNIKTMTEWTYNYDSLGAIKDSSISNYYCFDSLGRIIEKRFGYHSNKFKSYKYKYGVVPDTIYSDPFGPYYIGDGPWFDNRLILYCESRNRSYQIETITIQKKIEGAIFKMQYNYSELFVQHHYYKEYLISGLDYYENNKLLRKHKVIYENK
jgi:hypothetical protein